MTDWKDRLGVVFSTASEFEYKNETQNDNAKNIINEKQALRVFLDRKQRRGKQVTIIANFVGSDEDLKDLSKLVKTKCGVGGSVKDNEIIIQGDFREKIVTILKNEGFAKSRII